MHIHRVAQIIVHHSTVLYRAPMVRRTIRATPFVERLYGRVFVLPSLGNTSGTVGLLNYSLNRVWILGDIAHASCHVIIMRQAVTASRPNGNKVGMNLRVRAVIDILVAVLLHFHAGFIGIRAWRLIDIHLARYLRRQIDGVPIRIAIVLSNLDSNHIGINRRLRAFKHEVHAADSPRVNAALLPLRREPPTFLQRRAFVRQDSRIRIVWIIIPVIEGSLERNRCINRNRLASLIIERIALIIGNRYAFQKLVYADGVVNLVSKTLRIRRSIVRVIPVSPIPLGIVLQVGNLEGAFNTHLNRTVLGRAVRRVPGDIEGIVNLLTVVVPLRGYRGVLHVIGGNANIVNRHRHRLELAISHIEDLRQAAIRVLLVIAAVSQRRVNLGRTFNSDIDVVDRMLRRV